MINLRRIYVMEELINLCKKVVESLVHNNYEFLEQVNALSRVSKEDIKRVLKEYGGTLSTIPDDAFNTNVFQVYKFKNDSGYGIDLDLWINNCRSDLTLQLDVKTNEDDEIVSYIIDDIHVL